ncbi:hypothetical protein [Nostoc sp. GT001]|nr:hypothetical protein [Nostoc sp. GT001]MDM9584344.1 hypothetical protein [Nostoc sp. GT001]
MLKQITGGYGSDACIDAVGIEDHHIFQQKKDNSIKVILEPEW